MQGIDKGTRLFNYLVDLIVVFIVWVIATIILGISDTTNWVFYILMFSYYFVFEATTGQTLGKMVTKTKVVFSDGSQPSLFRILMRSSFRLIPFDAMSYLLGYEKGLYDILSSTKLVKTLEQEE